MLIKMLSLARVLPNPWLILGAVLALAGAFAYGLKIGNDRLESFKIAVEAVGKVAEERRKNVIEQQKLLKEETQREIQSALKVLADRYAGAVRMLDSRSRVRIVPAPKPSPARVPDTSRAEAPARYCADPGELDRRVDQDIRQAEAEALDLVRRIEEAATVGRACAAWAVKQEAVVN